MRPPESRRSRPDGSWIRPECRPECREAPRLAGSDGVEREAERPREGTEHDDVRPPAPPMAPPPMASMGMLMPPTDRPLHVADGAAAPPAPPLAASVENRVRRELRARGEPMEGVAALGVAASGVALPSPAKDSVTDSESPMGSFGIESCMESEGTAGTPPPSPPPPSSPPPPRRPDGRFCPSVEGSATECAAPLPLPPTDSTG